MALKKIHSVDYAAGRQQSSGQSTGTRNPSLAHSISIVVELAKETNGDLGMADGGAKPEVGARDEPKVGEYAVEDRSGSEEEEMGVDEEEEEACLSSGLARKVVLVDEADKILRSRAQSAEPRVAATPEHCDADKATDGLQEFATRRPANTIGSGAPLTRSASSAVAATCSQRIGAWAPAAGQTQCGASMRRNTVHDQAALEATMQPLRATVGLRALAAQQIGTSPSQQQFKPSTASSLLLKNWPQRRQSLQISLLASNQSTSLPCKSLTEEEVRGEREFNEQVRSAKSPDLFHLRHHHHHHQHQHPTHLTHHPLHQPTTPTTSSASGSHHHQRCRSSSGIEPRDQQLFSQLALDSSAAGEQQSALESPLVSTGSQRQYQKSFIGQPVAAARQRRVSFSCIDPVFSPTRSRSSVGQLQASGLPKDYDERKQRYQQHHHRASIAFYPTASGNQNSGFNFGLQQPDSQSNLLATISSSASGSNSISPADSICLQSPSRTSILKNHASTAASLQASDIQLTSSSSSSAASNFAALDSTPLIAGHHLERAKRHSLASSSIAPSTTARATSFAPHRAEVALTQSGRRLSLSTESKSAAAQAKPLMRSRSPVGSVVDEASDSATPTTTTTTTATTTIGGQNTRDDHPTSTTMARKSSADGSGEALESFCTSTISTSAIRPQVERTAATESGHQQDVQKSELLAKAKIAAALRREEGDSRVQSIMANAKLRQEEFAKLLEEHEQIVNEINRFETKISSSQTNLQQHH